MRQLTGLDASFLHMEDDHIIGHVAGLLVLDPSSLDEPFTADTVRRYIADRLHLLPSMRWRLVTVPLGLDLPYWRDDPDIDLDYHVRGIALPPNSGERELRELVARLVSRRLDRSFPLWEVYVIDGLPDGRVGILSKNHHAAVDGQSGVKIMTTLLSADRDATLRPPEQTATVAAEAQPNSLEIFLRGWVAVATNPPRGLRHAGKILWDALAAARALGLQAAVGAGSRVASLAPRTSFNASVSARRNWAFGTVSLEDVKTLKSRHDCTVNDVVMALCTSALRRWLIVHDELPDKPLVAMVPVSVRLPGQAGGGNQVSALTAQLPTQVADPLERLRLVRDGMRSAKEMHDALPASLLTDFTNFTAPAAAEFVARRAASLRWADRIRPVFNLTISNVPGPRETLWFAGAEMVATYPISMISDGMGLNITLQSYRDGLHFGLVSAPELVPDIDLLITYLEEAVTELLEA